MDCWTDSQKDRKGNGKPGGQSDRETGIEIQGWTVRTVGKIERCTDEWSNKKGQKKGLINRQKDIWTENKDRERKTQRSMGGQNQIDRKDRREKDQETYG